MIFSKNRTTSKIKFDIELKINISSYHKELTWLILIATLIRLIFSSATELGNVEVYYWSWSVKPQWSYFDHPPMVAWMISLTTLGQYLVTEVTIRLGSIISAAVCTIIIFNIGKQLRDDRAGWYAALLYTGCLYTSIGVGIYVLPDSPQLVFWMLSILLLLKLIAIIQMGQSSLRYWLLFGVAAGLCTMCKVHGVFLWVGVITYFLVNDRGQFKKPGLYMSALISLMIASPIIIWNFDHQWLNWKFQSNRFTVDHQQFNFPRFGKQFIEVVFVIGPISFYLIWQSVFEYLRGQLNCIGKQVQIILFCSLPLIVALFIISFFREVYPHWPGPAYAVLLALPALRIAEKLKDKMAMIPLIMKWAIYYCVIVLIIQVAFINYFPGTTSNEKDGLYTGKVTKP